MLPLSFPVTFYKFNQFTGIARPKTLHDLEALASEIRCLTGDSLSEVESLAQDILRGIAVTILTAEAHLTLCATPIPTNR